MSIFVKWLIAAIIIRFLAAWTHSSWFHPDEWYQTVEMGNLLAHGFGFYSQEVGLHLRNATWPLMLAAPLKFSEWLFPGDISFRVFSFGMLAGLINCAILWGWWQFILRFSKKHRLSNAWIHFSFILLVIPWFSVYDSVSPRNENLSQAATWLSLGFLVLRKWKWAGFFAVGIAAFRYPTGLFSAAIGIWMILFSIQSRQWKPVLSFSWGVVLGFLIFGLADWYAYGRPWESLWMYLQYNVFTGLSRDVFGSQPFWEYFGFFEWRWGRYDPLIPMWTVLGGAAIFGFVRAMIHKEVWAFCILFFFAGHFAIAHKEPRFLLPVETLVLWSVFYGVYHFRHSTTLALRLNWLFSPKRFIWVPKTAMWILLIMNGLFLLRAVWGENWIAAGTYREINDHKNDQTCAIITVKDPMAALLPWKKGIPIPDPALAALECDKRKPSFEQALLNKLSWVEHPPKCGESDHILLHLHRPDERWNQQGCELLPSGFLRILPKESWEWALKNNYAAGSWYRCPTKIRGLFKGEGLRLALSHSFGKIKKLPPIGVSGPDLIQLGKSTSPPPY